MIGKRMRRKHISDFGSRVLAMLNGGVRRVHYPTEISGDMPERRHEPDRAPRAASIGYLDMGKPYIDASRMPAKPRAGAAGGENRGVTDIYEIIRRNICENYGEQAVSNNRMDQGYMRIGGCRVSGSDIDLRATDSCYIGQREIRDETCSAGRERPSEAHRTSVSYKGDDTRGRRGSGVTPLFGEEKSYYRELSKREKEYVLDEAKRREQNENGEAVSEKETEEPLKKSSAQVQMGRTYYIGRPDTSASLKREEPQKRKSERFSNWNAMQGGAQPVAEEASRPPQGAERRRDRREREDKRVELYGASVGRYASGRQAAEKKTNDKNPRGLGNRSFSAFGGGLRLVSAIIVIAVIISSPVWLTSDTLLPYLKKLSATTASINLPGANAAAGAGIQMGVVVDPTTTAAEQTTAPTTEATSAKNDDPSLGTVLEQKIGNTGQSSGSVYVKNSTGYKLDINETLKLRPDCDIKLNAGYQVLIVHTHTTEGYAEREDGLYSKDYSPRTTDKSKSVVALGDIITDKLNAAGIKTLHATTVHDYPQYNGSYDRANETIRKYLKQYPSIEMVIDVHRDAVTRDDGTKVKPTVTINGKKAAQIMIITGCDAGGKLDFPNWRTNMRMALRLQRRVGQSYDGLMRPLNFAPYRYNMHLTPNSLLVEFGTDVNTLDEARYSAELFGNSLVEELQQYVV